MTYASTLKKEEQTDLGTFEVKSGKLVVSDPCYDRGTWCAGLLDKVKNGIWKALVLKAETSDELDKYSDIRITTLIVAHESLSETEFENATVEAEDSSIEVGVDSGQAGFFDEPKYKVDYEEPYAKVGYQEYDNSSWVRMREHLNESRKYIEAHLSTPHLLVQQLQDQRKEAVGCGGIFTGKPILDLYDVMIETKMPDKFQEMLDIVEGKLGGEPEETTEWYQICCDITLSNMSAGVLDGGAVSSSGFGDGGYSCYVTRNSNGYVVFATIVFITDGD